MQTGNKESGVPGFDSSTNSLPRSWLQETKRRDWDLDVSMEDRGNVNTMSPFRSASIQRSALCVQIMSARLYANLFTRLDSSEDQSSLVVFCSQCSGRRSPCSARSNPRWWSRAGTWFNNSCWSVMLESFFPQPVGFCLNSPTIVCE